MIHSMTGYGAGEAEDGGIRTTVEVRSVNGRFCEISVKTPKTLASLEGRIREYIQARVTRGTVSVSVRRDGDGNGTTVLAVDLDAGRRYYQALQHLQETLQVPGEITLGMLTAYPGLLKPVSDELDVEQAWGTVEQALASGLDAMFAMKIREGDGLARDMTARMNGLDAALDAIERRAPLRVQEARQRLTERVAGLLGDQGIDPQRLAQEITLFADRSDISEECVRFRSHTQAFLAALQADDMAGRRLNFLLQELNREANTIGSKANDVEISHWVITIKEELERVREQVQNIE